MLSLPRAPEACPHGLAPTTSTLLQLVIGDALAVALLEARGFTPDHFRTFHPGGQLGANLTHVREIMHSGDEMPVVALGTKMPEAMMMLSQEAFGCVCVVDGGGRLAGIITDGDLARNLHRNLADAGGRRDHDAAAEDGRAGDAGRRGASAMLNEHHISALIVVDDDKPVGVVHFHDLLRIGAA